MDIYGIYLTISFFRLQEERYREYRKNRRKEKKKRDEDEASTSFGGGDDMAALMGFSGFGGTKKS
jgi:U4/U6.U5 tri-snRNP component SNU23